MSEPSTSPPTIQRLQPSSSPSTVRTYFTTVLHELHGLPESEAASIAAACKLGRGSELLLYDLQTFRDLFGSEGGMLLYNYARRDAVQKDPAQAGSYAHCSILPPLTQRTLFGVEPSYVLVEFFFLATVYFSVMATRDCDSVEGNAIAGILGSNSFLAASAFMISYILYSIYFRLGEKESLVLFETSAFCF